MREWESAWESASERVRVIVRVGERLRMHVGARESALFLTEIAPESGWESVCGSACASESVWESVVLKSALEGV